jgi:hypothetical protein|tara:strand:+ start:277 stop:450 length:174 start_codon:yes stop_codon:yes gene_type:complete
MNDSINLSPVRKVSKAKTGAERQKTYRIKKSATHIEFNVWIRLENLNKAKELYKQLG